MQDVLDLHPIAGDAGQFDIGGSKLQAVLTAQLAGKAHAEGFFRLIRLGHVAVVRHVQKGDFHHALHVQLAAGAAHVRHDGPQAGPERRAGRRLPVQKQRHFAAFRRVQLMMLQCAPHRLCHRLQQIALRGVGVQHQAHVPADRSPHGQAQQHLRPQGAFPFAGPFLRKHGHILDHGLAAEAVAVFAQKGHRLFKGQGMPGDCHRPGGHMAAVNYFQQDIAGHRGFFLAAHHVLHGGKSRGVQGVRDLQNVRQLAFLPYQHLPRAGSRRAQTGKRLRFQHQPFGPVNARHHGKGFIREKPGLGLQNRHQMQPPALRAGFHMLHAQAQHRSHAVLRAGKIHAVGKLRRGFQRADQRRVALGIQHMKGDFALRVHPAGLNVRLFQHRHGLGA